MLSIRLSSLAKFIDYNDNLIDIGCDHALLDIYLVKSKIIRSLIVSDIHENALKSGIQNIKKEKLEDKIEARLGDGLNVLNKKDKCDTILISGMGTSTILNILSHDRVNEVNKLILQSNNDHYLLRSELIKKGFIITNEEYFIDNNKNYINIVFKRGNKKYSKKELRYGPILIHNKAYLNFELNNIKKIQKLIPNNKLKYKISLWNESRVLNKLINKS